MASNPRSRRLSSPKSLGNPPPRPADESWKVLLDIKGAVERLDERTGAIKTDLTAAKLSIASIPSRQMFLSGIIGVITVFGLIATAYWFAVSAKFEAVNVRLDALKSQAQSTTPPQAR